MTFILVGRWQTRLFLLMVVGLPVTAVFAWFYGSVQPLALLGYVLLLGLGWDVLYNYGQTWRWNRDWPPLFVWVAGLWEGLFLWTLLHLLWVLGLTLPGVMVGVGYGRFAAHYLTVFALTWVGSQSLLPILFPRWRFHGGQWLEGRR